MDEEDRLTPAQFPTTDVDEAETQAILTSCIHPRYVKLEFETRDKYPNRDGTIEITDEEGYPVGDLVIQVKKLNPNRIDPPRHSVPIGTLEYARRINPPLLLLGVDIGNEVVYWKHISRNWLEKHEASLSSQETMTVDFTVRNQLDGESTTYIDAWQRIADPQVHYKGSRYKEGYHAFISHASQDREFVRALADELIEEYDVDVWYEEYEVKGGDNLTRTIDKAISESKYRIVVLSDSFFQKAWTDRGYNRLVARATQEESRVLPIWYDIDHEDVRDYSPPLADLFAVSATSETDIPYVAREIFDVLVERYQSHRN